MAQRLATEYVKTCLQLSEAELLAFVQSFAEHQVHLNVKVMENGNQEVVLEDASGDEIAFSFERRGNRYILEGSCRLLNPKLVNVMRNIVATYKGDAVVNRIYSSYTMVYHYVKGSVVRIIESRGDGSDKLIYEYKDTLGQLEQLFNKRQIEAEIVSAQRHINELLDMRNRTRNPEAIREIDAKLKHWTHQLFVLEA